jgi:hypothetical protein
MAFHSRKRIGRDPNSQGKRRSGEKNIITLGHTLQHSSFYFLLAILDERCQFGS